MKKILFAMGTITMACFYAANISAEESASMSLGETKFKEQCAVCHPNGANIINPKKTLHKQDREANNIKVAADIVKTMRNPGPGMTKFDKETIPDTEAQAIAQYILKTF
jgi:cytochrome c6